MQYIVNFYKKQTYIVKANSIAEAEDAAVDMLIADKTAFCDDKIDEIEVEEV